MSRSAITLARPTAWYRSWYSRGAKAGTETGSAHLFRINPAVTDRDGTIIRPESLGPACGCPFITVKGAGYTTPRSADRMPCGLCARILASHQKLKSTTTPTRRAS